MLGPSGCGKTTTLRMIAGFEVPDEGRVVLRGADVTNVPPNHRNVNTVFQHYALFPHMSVLDNVSFGLELKRVPRGERRDRVKEMLQGRPARRHGEAQAAAALRRPAAARRARPCAREPAGRAPSRRAARRARRQAPQADAARAEADPDRARHDVRLRHARPGRGADHVGPDRGHERRRHRADRRPEGDLRASADTVRRRLRGLSERLRPARRRGRGRARRHARERAGTTRRPGRGGDEDGRRASRRRPAGTRSHRADERPRARGRVDASREPWPSSSISAG